MGLKETYDDAMRAYNSSILDQENRFQKALLDDDQYEQTAATMELASLHVQRDRYHTMAEQHAHSLRVQRPSNRWGLSETEREVAEASLPDRPDMPKLTADQKHEVYANNRARLNRMRQTREYDDTQGRVFK
jgi:hypothetical protein